MVNWKNFRFMAVFASLTLAACTGSTEDGRFGGLSYYERGKAHFNVGQFGLAVKHFQSAVNREPGSVESLNGLAASYDRLGRFDLATRYYSRALAAEPGSTQTLNNIGYSYLLQERYDLAVAYLREAHAGNQKDPVILANRKVAEVAYRDDDLKRSAEMARAGRKEVLRERSDEIVAAKPNVRITVATAPPLRPASPPRGPVKPWIERTAPKVQTLVTQPQTALLGVMEQTGVRPQIAAYRPQESEVEQDLLPELLTAPMVLDGRSPTAVDESILPEATEGGLEADEPNAAPAASLDLPEVTVASLEPVLPLQDAGPRVEEPDAPVLAILGSPEVTEGGLDSGEPNAAPAMSLDLPEVTVASLEPVLPLQDAGPRIEEPDAPAMAILLSPEITDDGFDPLDSIEDTPLANLPQAVSSETQIASLDPIVSVGPTVAAKKPYMEGQLLPLIEVSNGTGRLSMAMRIRRYLESEGLVIRRLSNAETFTHQETTIFYREGWKSYADDLARLLPAVISLEGRFGQTPDIRLELGGDLLNFDRGLFYTVGKPAGAYSG